MPIDRTERPSGVILAALVLAVMAAIGLLVAGLSIAALFLTHHPIIPKIPSVRIFIICFDLLMLLILIWCIWTVIGLFQFKPWARHSILAIGALDLCFFGLQSLGLLFLRSRYDFSMMMPSGPGAIHVSTVMLEIAAFDALLALIGLWWLIYFNLSHVRQAFDGSSLRQSMRRA
jgi:hypothetical protein